MVPIRWLGSSHRERIRRYTDGLNFERDDIYGICNHNRKLTLIAMAHVAFSEDRKLVPHAEFGVPDTP